MMHESEKLALKEKIFRAAIKEFADKGFYSASIRDIARNAKIRDSYFYYFFKNKEEILAETLKRCWGDILKRVKKEIIGITEPIEMMQILFAIVGKYLLQEEPEMGVVMLIDGRKEWGIEEKLITEEQAEFFEIMEKIIFEAQKRGIYRSDYNIEAARQALFGMGDDLVLGLHLKSKTNYKANYSFEDAANICGFMQAAFFSVRKTIEELKKDPGNKAELVSRIAEDEELFRLILEKRNTILNK